MRSGAKPGQSKPKPGADQLILRQRLRRALLVHFESQILTKRHDEYFGRSTPALTRRHRGATFCGRWIRFLTTTQLSCSGSIRLSNATKMAIRIFGPRFRNTGEDLRILDVETVE